jgi:hypothetical protein
MRTSVDHSGKHAELLGTRGLRIRFLLLKLLRKAVNLYPNCEILEEFGCFTYIGYVTVGFTRKVILE